MRRWNRLPLPKPENNESEKVFIKRCMSDDIMVAEYDDQKRRVAVCYSQWRRYKKENSEDNWDIDDLTKEKIVDMGTGIAKEIVRRKKDDKMKFLISPEEGSKAYQKFWKEVKKDLTEEEIRWLTVKEAALSEEEINLTSALDNPSLVKDLNDDELEQMHNELHKEYESKYPAEKDKKSEINKITNKDIKEKFDIGLITLNEARKELGLEPVDNGNKLKSEFSNANKNPEQLEKDQIDTALKEKELKIQEKRQELLERLEDELNG